MFLKLLALKASVFSGLSLIVFLTNMIDAKAAEKLLVEYGGNAMDDPPSREYQGVSLDITNNIRSQAIRSSDELCSSSRYDPHVVGYAPGSFTSPYANETLYLVHIGDSCGPRHIGTIRILVDRGNQITPYGEVSGSHSIKKITDINNDGINEILLEFSWLGQGYFSVGNRLLEIQPQGILTLAQFQTYGNSRGTLSVPDLTTGIQYRVSTEQVSQVYYELGSNNKLSGLRSDWRVRVCSKIELDIQAQCTAFEPLFSYRIPLSDSFDDNFFPTFNLSFQPWFHNTCHNTCEVYNP